MKKIKRDIIGMAIRKLRLRWDRKRKGVRPPLRGSLCRSVAAICYLSKMKLSAVKVGIECVLLIREVERPSNILQVPRLQSKDYNGDTENDDTSATSCSTDNIILYSLRSPISMWSPTHFTDAEPETIIGATDIRDSYKRTADRARLNDGGEGVHRLKTRCAV